MYRNIWHLKRSIFSQFDLIAYNFFVMPYLLHFFLLILLFYVPTSWCVQHMYNMYILMYFLGCYRENVALMEILMETQQTVPLILMLKYRSKKVVPDCLHYVMQINDWSIHQSAPNLTQDTETMSVYLKVMMFCQKIIILSYIIICNN